MGREWINRPSSKVTEEIIRQSSCAAISGPEKPDSSNPHSTNLRGTRMALATATLAGALSGGCTKPENSPTPVRPTPDNPNPTPTLIDKTPTPVRPTSTPTVEVKTPTPEATPTVIAINIPLARGPITEATPTPDTQREALTGKAKLYYEKNPLTVKGSQLNGILVSERTSADKILISVRTFTGTMETAVLAGNWGYFSANDKSEITGIIWAKQDTFTDSQGKTGYLGDSEIATTGTGFFGVKQVGYWTKDGKMIATLDSKTGEPKPLAPEPSPTKLVDLTIPADLKVNLSEVQLQRLNIVSEAMKEKTRFKIIPNAQMTIDGFISAMGITDPALIRLYKQFFTGNTKESHNIECSGLGVFYTSGEVHGPGQGSGILWGFLPQSQVSGNVTQFAEKEGFTAQPLWAVIQIRPGKNLSPDTDPGSFIVVSVGLFDKKGSADGTRMSLGVSENSKLDIKIVEKIDTATGKKYLPATDVWSVQQWKDLFGLKKSTPVHFSFDFDETERFVASAFIPIVPAFPTAAEQQAGSFSLK